MNKNIEVLFDHTLNSPDSRSGFDTPELNELYSQLEASCFRKSERGITVYSREEKDRFEELLNRFQREAQKTAFERGFYTAINTILDGGGKHGE
ncbi:MAG: hypothetical protein IKG98_12290 [Ruminococcus sp.]|nr:hypothetical protein [Ruminococcus sp.]